MMQPSRVRMLWRGFTKRCARCGSRHLFTRWFTMVPECPRCGLHFEREAGYWTGALAINMIIVGGLFVVGFVILLVLTVPEVPVAPVLAVLVPVAIIGPMIAYPFSKTLWVAVDRAFLQKLDRNERADEQVRHI
jgi:uncharacterized protein (DUF983 family)